MIQILPGMLTVLDNTIILYLYRDVNDLTGIQSLCYDIYRGCLSFETVWNQLGDEEEIIA